MFKLFFCNALGENLLMSRRKGRSAKGGTASPDDRPQRPSNAAAPLRHAQTRRRWQPATLLAACLIVLAILASYSNSFSGPFIFDDAKSIVDNSTIRELGAMGNLLSPPNQGETVSGRPVLNLSLALNYAVSRCDVHGYHITNLAIHLAAALLLFGIVRRTAATLVPRLRRSPPRPGPPPPSPSPSPCCGRSTPCKPSR